jgi:hypothetical protein
MPYALLSCPERLTFGPPLPTCTHPPIHHTTHPCSPVLSFLHKHTNANLYPHTSRSLLPPPPPPPPPHAHPPMRRYWRLGKSKRNFKVLMMVNSMLVALMETLRIAPKGMMAVSAHEVLRVNRAVGG